MSEVVIVPDIAVCHGGALRSLRGQKVVKSCSLERFEGGSGVAKEGVLYVLEDDWVVKMTTTGVEVALGMKCDEDMTLDWGDGELEIVTKTGSSSPVGLTHQYDDGIATHVIYLKGSRYALTSLTCGNIMLTYIDISKNAMLTFIDCGINMLTQLDISQNKLLIQLGCNSNLLTELNVSQNVALEMMGCNDNQLLKLDFSQNKSLVRIDCGYNSYTTDAISLKALADSLPNRSGQRNGELYIDVNNDELTSICTSKNWIIKEPYT